MIFFLSLEFCCVYEFETFMALFSKMDFRGLKYHFNIFSRLSLRIFLTLVVLEMACWILSFQKSFSRLSLWKYFLALVVLKSYLVFVALKMVLWCLPILSLWKWFFASCPFESGFYRLTLWKLYVAGRLENDFFDACRCGNILLIRVVLKISLASVAITIIFWLLSLRRFFWSIFFWK